MVRSNKNKHAVEMKISGARIKAAGNKTWQWVDCGSQTTVRSINDLKRKLSKANFYPQPNVESCYYYNNGIQILGKSDVTIELKEWATKGKVLVIAWNDQSFQSFLGCDFMEALGVELVQKGKVTRIAEEEDVKNSHGLEKWQT